MARDLNQQQKLLLLQQYLLEETDEDHSVSIQDIIGFLSSKGISAERKSIYENIETLKLCGLDIYTERQGNRNLYRVVDRDFEIAELRLLADAVASSRFITARKSAQLLKKISGLASRHQGAGLQRQVYVASRIKNMNETIYRQIDALNTAIESNTALEFCYYDWALDGQALKKVPRHHGRRYTVSPWQLLWQDEFYYLIAYDHAFRQIRHYRVDRIDNIVQTELPRQGEEAFREIHMEDYTARVFGMFAGETRRVTIGFPNRFLEAMIDRFGKEPPISRRADGTLEITVDVIPSQHFFGWLFSLGEEVTLLSPTDLKQEYIAALRLELEKELNNG